MVKREVEYFGYRVVVVVSLYLDGASPALQSKKPRGRMP